MNKILAVFGLATLNAVAAPSVDQVLVRQQWPWSTDVKVEYVVSGLTSPVDMSVSVFNGQKQYPSSAFASSLKGEFYGVSENGSHSFFFSPTNLTGETRSIIGDFKVKVAIAGESDADRAKAQYRIFDLVTGEVTDVHPCDDMSGNRLYDHFMTAFSQVYSTFTTELSSIFVWSDVVAADNLYRTRKLVLKRIPAAGVVWKMGSPSTEADRTEYETQHNVKLTKDFWIGVFPITQYQYNLLMGTKASLWTEDGWEIRPADNVSYNMIRGANAVWPDANGKPSYAVDEGSFLHALRAKFGNSYRFDLPTEAQYEFATRGGNYEADNYTGLPRSTENFHNLICRNNYNKGSGWQNHEVGRFNPNAWGLYDMVGTVREWVLDWGDWDADYVWTADPEVDPVGPQSSANGTRRQRGCTASGVIGPKFAETRSAYRGGCSVPTKTFSYWNSSMSAAGDFAFRVCITED